MTEEELKQVAEMAAKAAQDATKATFQESSKELSESLKKEIEAGKAEMVKIGEQVVKFEKSIKGVSIQHDLGGGKKELGFSKGKMYRGLILNRWDGADMEREIANQVSQKAMEAGVGSAGGFLIPTEMSNDIVQLVRDRNVLRELGVMEVNAKRASYEVPKITGGSTAYMVGEGKAITESQMTAGMMTLTPKKGAALLSVSREMIASADAGFVAILESDLADELAKMQMTQALYGNGGVSPVGLFHSLAAAQKLAVGAAGDDPSKTFLRQLRSKVPQKYANANMKFLMNEDVAYKIAALVSAAAPDAAATQADEVLVRNALGKAYSTTGLIPVDKTKGNGTALSDVFYGDWAQFMLATWWGGLRIESTTEGGNAFANDLMMIKAVLPFDVGLRRPDALACATYVKTINS